MPEPDQRAMFGVYDTQDNVWLGEDEGPTLFDDFMVARIAAEMADVRLKWKLNRCQAREFPVELLATLRLRDHQENHMSAEEALRRMEMGLVP